VYPAFTFDTPARRGPPRPEDWGKKPERVIGPDAQVLEEIYRHRLLPLLAVVETDTSDVDTIKQLAR
jgi:hypothetical protein